MAWTLSDIQTQIAFEIDGNATIAATSTDWASRLHPINRSIIDWEQTYDWKELMSVHNGVISTSTGNASYALPANFNKMHGYPKITYDGSTTKDFPIVLVERNYQYTDSDLFVNVLGNSADNKVMVIHSNALVSGASVQFTYFKKATSLSSTGQYTECPDPTYIVQKALYYIYKSKEDARFPEAKAEADRIMARMIENENTLGIGYVDRGVSNPNFTNFRVGRDG